MPLLCDQIIHTHKNTILIKVKKNYWKNWNIDRIKRTTLNKAWVNCQQYDSKLD